MSLKSRNAEFLLKHFLCDQNRLWFQKLLRGCPQPSRPIVFSSTKRIKMFELISWLLTILATVRLTTNLFVQNAVSRTTLSSFWLLADGLSVVCLPILMFSGHQLGVLKWLFLALFAIFYFLRFVLYVIGLRNSPGQGRVSGTNGTADWSTRVSAFQISSINTRLTTLLGLIVLAESTLFCGYACQSVEAWLDRQKFKAF